MRFNGLSISTSRIGMVAALFAGVCGGRVLADTTITFSPQSGSTGDPFVSDTESGFTVVPTTSGNWFQSQAFGNPAPSIFDGPIGNPSIASIEVTDGGGFTFKSLDQSSNNGDSDFSITGSAGGTAEFTETGVFANSSPSGFSFTTYSSTVGDSSVPIDTLDITITPTGGPTSVNLDNIVLGSVPEPTSISLGLGLAALGLQRRRRSVR
jgi:uncharacterized protein (TIGR03382 family)